MFPRLAFALVALVALAAASPAPAPAPIEEKLQPIIAAKNNMGGINPPQPKASSNAAAVSGRMLVSSLSGAALVTGVVVLL